MGEKEFYIEKEASQRVEEHAEKYLIQRSEQLKSLNSNSSFNPILIAPFDAELFGHWWYEGPLFIKNIIKKSSTYLIKLNHLKGILTAKPSLQICDPSPSSWGQGGFHNYWLNDKNAWIVPQITKAGSIFVDIISKSSKDEMTQRILKQAARELLLSESSDWSFILRAGTTTELARERINRHLNRFWELIKNLNDIDFIDIDYLKDIEDEDNIFPDIKVEDWVRKIN